MSFLDDMNNGLEKIILFWIIISLPFLVLRFLGFILFTIGLIGLIKTVVCLIKNRDMKKASKLFFISVLIIATSIMYSVYISPSYIIMLLLDNLLGI